MMKKLFNYLPLLILFAVVPSAMAQDNCMRNTITVSGTGTVKVVPDMANFSVYYTYTAPTTSEAKKNVAKTMRKVMDLLKEFGVDDRYMQTSSFNYDVEYDYSKGKRVKLGQRASQSISVSVNRLDSSPTRLDSILDRLSSIDKIEVQNISFDIENKAEFYKRSRELAFEKAKSKAEQYARLAGRRLGKAITISENMSQDAAVISTRKMAVMNMAVEESAGMDDGISLPTGEQGVSSIVHVVFEMVD